MFEFDAERYALTYINILVTDFVTGFKSIFISEETLVKRFFHPRFDIHVVIDAPKTFVLKWPLVRVFSLLICAQGKGY